MLTTVHPRGQLTGSLHDEFNLLAMPQIGGVIGSTLTREELTELVAKGTEALELPVCEYTQAHTRTWCGVPTCRAS